MGEGCAQNTTTYKYPDAQISDNYYGLSSGHGFRKSGLSPEVPILMNDEETDYRILHLNERDTKGGAARAAYRLHTELRELGHDSHMLVNYKSSDEEHVHGPSGTLGKIHSEMRRRADRLPTLFYRNRSSSPFSPAWLPERVNSRIEKLDPDLVNCHWTTGGFINPASLEAIDVPVVWTLHDMWAFTGGCHYSGNCKQYEDKCGDCPQLGSDSEDDLSRSLWQRKHEQWNDFDPHIVTPSNWLGQCAADSSLLGECNIRTIHNGINTRKFKPSAADGARNALQLPENRPLVLFGAHYQTRRKGFHHLVDASKYLPDSVEFVTFGGGFPESHGLSNRIHNLGYVTDEELVALYACVDLMVVPSVQDNLPNTALEAISSGTPVVAFDIGGMSDIVNTGSNGYLVPPFDDEALADRMLSIVQDQSVAAEMSKRAREMATEQFTIKNCAQQYQDLYGALLGRV